MNYIDLLNYLTDVQKIEKEDLAELIGIPQKKMDSVLCGAVSFKKKWLKNLSLYTGIPKEAILAGNFVLSAPEGELAPVVKDAYVPEAIRQGNTQRLNAYVKKRYKNFHDDAVSAHFFGVFFSVISIIVSIVALAAFSMVSLSGTQATATTDFISVLLIGLVPALICVSVIRNSFRFAKNGVPADEKTFKFYAILATIPLLMSVITAIVFKWISPFTIVVAIVAFLPLIYTVFVSRDGIAHYEKAVAWIAVSCVLIFGIFFVFLDGDKLQDVQSSTLAVMYAGIYLLNSTFTTWAFVSVCSCYNFYQKKKAIVKYFGPVVKKPAFKSGRIAKSIIAIIIAAAVILSTVYIAPVFVVEKVMAMSFGFSGVENKPRFFDYEKSNTVFEENEDVTIVDNKNFTMKLPSYMITDNESKTFERYKTEEKNLYVTIYDEYNSFEGIFNIGSYGAEYDQINQFMEGLEKAVLQRYGFLPKSEYEYGKLMRMVYEDEISPFDRDLRLASILLKSADHFALENFTLYLYEDAEKEISIKEYISQREDGKHVRLYNINGNVKGDYDKFVSIDIAVLENNVGDVNTELPYKIINSIEMK